MNFNKQDALLFFERCPEAYPLYEKLENVLAEQFPQSSMKVQKSQISFYNRHMYACVSFMQLKKKSELPPVHFVLTLGLPYPLESGRVAVKTEPYPGRWTTHIIIRSESDIGPELIQWIGEAYDFARSK